MRWIAATTTLLLSLLSPWGAMAQQEGASTAIGSGEEGEAKPAPAKEPEVVVRGGQKSPHWTTTRNFTGTRFWRLDPGQQEFELWYSARLHKDGDGEVKRHLWHTE